MSSKNPTDLVRLYFHVAQFRLGLIGTLSRLTSSMVLKPLKIMNDGEIVKEGHLRRLKVKKNDFQICQNDAVWLLQAAIQTSLTPTLN